MYQIMDNELEYQKRPSYNTANPLSYPIIKVFKEELKQKPTKAEIVLWQYLKTKKTGHKIRKQHIIDDYIVDFVCLEKHLVIEVDGRIHEFQKKEDKIRTSVLNLKGFSVIRFTNEEVLMYPQTVAGKIKLILDNREG